MPNGSRPIVVNRARRATPGARSTSRYRPSLIARITCPNRFSVTHLTVLPAPRARGGGRERPRGTARLPAAVVPHPVRAGRRAGRHSVQRGGGSRLPGRVALPRRALGDARERAGRAPARGGPPPRPVRALASGGGAPPREGCAPGVAGRLTMAWSLGTGIPLLGISVIAVASLFHGEEDAGLVAAAVAFLAAIGMVVGMLSISMAARSVAEPVAAVRRAIARIEDGELDVTVPVDDGSEVGLLEAGFNRMAAGLRERERLHDLFGRHVGRDVARAALENDGEVELGGEVREVAALFVDLTGSTRLAARQPPAEVVALLNRFFCIVVELVEEHGGWVNKFEGDAALCVFGAPVPRHDAASDALRAARGLRERLVRELRGADAGIGVSAGPAVAGNVGAKERFEYTVIGDPVNEAARLCELAKDHPGRLLASDAVLRRAGDEEAAHWVVRRQLLLRGRDRETGLAEPRRPIEAAGERTPATLTPAVGT